MRQLISVLILVLLPTMICAAHPDDIYWSDGFGPPSGVSGYQYISGGFVRSAVEYDGKLILGGDFRFAGSDTACGVASWDGVTVSAYGSCFRAWVDKLIVYQNRLYRFGGYDDEHHHSQGASAVLIDGIWQPIEALHGVTTNAIIYQDKLVVFGGIDSVNGQPANGMALFDGNAWTPVLDVPGNNHYWVTLDTCWGKLVMATPFYRLSLASPELHLWDGTAWESPDLSSTGFINDVASYGGNLIVAGLFDSLGGVPVKNLAQYDGATWCEFAGGCTSQVYSLCVVDSQIVALGLFDSIGGVAAHRTATWDGTSWNAMGMGPTSITNARPILQQWRDKTIAVGEFYIDGGDWARYNLAWWDGHEWSRMYCGGISDNVVRLTEYRDQLIAGGTFVAAGNTAANSIAAFDGSAWHTLDQTHRSVHSWGVTALCEWQDSLVVGGWFDSLGGAPALRIGAWDGAHWSQLSDSIPGQPFDFFIHRDSLIAIGSFHFPGMNSRQTCVVWLDGREWKQLGPALTCNQVPNTVLSVSAVGEYDASLIVGGHFDSCEARPMANIASWDGTTWQPLASPANGKPYHEIYDLIIYDNKLIACGYFSQIDGVPACNIAQYDGASWSPLGRGVGVPELTYANCMTIYEGQLIVGGYFDSAGGFLVNNIAAWDGETWSSLGSGIGSTVKGSLWDLGRFGGHALVAELNVFQNALYVAGDFLQAGDKISFGIAKWTKHTPTDVEEPSDSPLPHSLLLQQNYPNPFNPTTMIEYELPLRTHVTITIVNALGQHVRTLVDTDQPAGQYSLEWDGRNQTGHAMASGTYFYRLTAGGKIESKKMLLLK